MLVSTNPSKNFAVVGEIETSSLEEVYGKVAAARLAFPAWRDLGVAGRLPLLRTLGERFKERAEELAQLTAQEMGMPIAVARGDITDTLNYWESYLGTAEANLRPVVAFENEHEVHILHRIPRGVVACIVPWNFPFANVVWQCGQNLVAGNVVALKHSEETPLTGKLIADIITSVLPEGVFSEVYGDGAVGQTLIEQDVDFICFTGSTATGKLISQQAGGRLIPTSMELGGSAPGVVLGDADLASTVEAVTFGRLANAGQLCDGLKRLIIPANRKDEIVTALQAAFTGKKIGDALDESTELGPLVAMRQVDLLEEQVSDAVEKGATVVCGGKRPAGLQGAYYEPTILTGVTPSMRVWQEEVFGPVLPVVTFDDESEALRLANDTQYGLGGYVFTQDNEQFQRVAMAIDTCMVSQNSLSYVRPEDMFGGCKKSGNGREHGPEGFAEVTLSKIIAQEK